MIYPDDARVFELRREDPHGRSSTHELERAATVEALAQAVERNDPAELKDILETIVSLLR